MCSKFQLQDYTLMSRTDIFLAQWHISIDENELKDNHCITMLVIQMLER